MSMLSVIYAECRYAKCLYAECPGTISPTNLTKVQRCQHMVNGTKDAVLFHQHLRFNRLNFAAYFRIQLLRLAPYFGTVLPNAVAIKSNENYL